MNTTSTLTIQPKRIRPYVSIKRKKYLNEQLTCEARGCNIKREALSIYCSKHYDAQSMYGQPFGRRLLRSKDYKYEYDLTKKFIESHLSHIGIGQALDFINSWLTSSDTDSDTYLDARRLSDYGVSSLDILIESTSIWVMSKFQPRVFPTDKSLTYAIANGVLHLAPRYSYPAWVSGVPRKSYTRIPPKVRKALGSYLINNLGLLYINIHSTLEHQLKAKEQHKLNFMKPFSTQHEADQ